MVVKPGWRPPKIYSPQIITGESPDQMIAADHAIWRGRIIDEILRCLSYNFPAIRSVNGRLWTANGAVFYKDQSLLEAANAESRPCSIEGVLQEKASELMLNQALLLAVESRKIDSLNLYKNNVGPASPKDLFNEVTFGSHHNYSYLASKQSMVFRILESFVPAGLVLSGNGHVFKYGGNFFYLLSQRANHIVARENNSSTNNRPIVNTRDEALMDGFESLSRLHLISRDATRCELQTWLMDGVTHLVLRLAEEGWELPSNYSIQDPVGEMRNVNFSFAAGLDYSILCGDYTGSFRLNIIRYNRIFLDAAKQLNPLSVREKKCLEEWERILSLLEAGALEKLVGELDWVTKWHLLEKAMKKFGFGLEDKRAWRMDWDYHNISSDPRISLYAALEQKDVIRRLVSEEDIRKTILTPPQSRAMSRGRFVKLFRQEEKLRSAFPKADMDWQKVILRKELLEKSDKPLVIPFGGGGNPFSTENPDLEELYKKLGISSL